MTAFNEFPHLFSPITLGPLTLKNRLQFAPHVSAHADAETGRVTQDLIDYIAGQARTGVGLITIGSTPVEFARGRDYMGCLSVANDFDTPGLSLLAEAAHRFGAKLSCELQFAGRIADPMFLGGMKALVPWVAPDMDPKEFAEITKEEIADVRELFVKAAVRLKKAGFDMLMLHGGHGNLTSAFFSPLTNQRTDEYGGSMENRMRYGLELTKAVREAVGNSMAVEFRMSSQEWLPGSPSWDDLSVYINRLSEYVDVINLSNGIIWHPYYVRYMMPSYMEPRCLNVEASAYLKQRVKIPISVVGNIPDVYAAEEILARGQADMISMARNLIADSAFAVKAYHGQADDIRPCLHCLDCVTFPNVGRHVRCAVNPLVGRETEFFNRTPKPEKAKKIMIIGGGPAGMMAAQTCAKQGHNVTLYEKSDRLGGRLYEASALEAKDYHRRYLAWDVRQTMQCGAKIVLNADVTPALIEAEQPDVLLIAVGAKYLIPPIPGLREANCITVTEADLAEKPIGHRVIFLGGGLSCMECAIGLSNKGHECVLIDRLPKDGLMNELMDSLKLTFLTTCEEMHIPLLDNANIVEVGKDYVLIERDGKRERIEGDTVVLGLGLAPDAAAIERFTGIVPDTYVIGDAEHAGNIRHANTQAFNTAIDI